MKYAALLLIASVLYAAEGSPSRNPACQRSCPFNPFCGTKTNCYYGKETDYCNCCTRCLQGPRERCGGVKGLEGNCATGLYCDKSGHYQSTTTNPIGSCRRISTSHCRGHCNPYSCPHGSRSPYCRFGSEKDACGCCDICLKGVGESCGGFNNDFGRCANGLYCDESYVVFGRQPGRCQIWTAFDYPTQNTYYGRQY